MRENHANARKSPAKPLLSAQNRPAPWAFCKAKERSFLDRSGAAGMARIWLQKSNDGEVVWSEDFPGQRFTREVRWGSLRENSV
jgi:hypothetical protein